MCRASYQAPLPLAGLLKGNCTIGDTAPNGTDYAKLSGMVWIPAGKASAFITMPAKEDLDLEGSETVVLTLAPGACYTLGDPSTATVKIRDRYRAIGGEH